MRISKLLSFFALLLPLQTFAEIYDVSTTTELREALASAAEAGGDNTIRLAAGTYSTQDDGEGRFEYVSQQPGVISLIAFDDSNKPMLHGNEEDQILVLYGVEKELSVTISGLEFKKGRVAIEALTRLDKFVIENSNFLENKPGGACGCYAETLNIFSLITEKHIQAAEL